MIEPPKIVTDRPSPPMLPPKKNVLPLVLIGGAAFAVLFVVVVGVVIMNRGIDPPAADRAEKQQPSERSTTKKTFANVLQKTVTVPAVDPIKAVSFEDGRYCRTLTGRNMDRVQFTMLVDIKNISSTAIESIDYEVRVINPNRTVPRGSSKGQIEIRGGIEPGETTNVKVNAPCSELIGNGGVQVVEDEELQIRVTKANGKDGSTEWFVIDKDLNPNKSSYDKEMIIKW